MRAVVFVVVLAMGQPALAQPPGKKDAPKPLPADVAKAWKEAGATVGWMRASLFTHHG